MSDKPKRRGPLWEDGKSGWENAPDYAVGPLGMRGWAFVIVVGAVLLLGPIACVFG